MSGYIDLAEYQPQSSDSDKINRQNWFFDLEFWRKQVHDPSSMPWCHGPINPWKGLIGGIPWCNGIVACHAEIKQFDQIKCRPLLKRGLMVFVRVDQHSSTLTTDQKWFLKIFNDFGRFLIISILQFYRKRFFLQKKAPAGKCTHSNKFFNDS